MRQPSTTQKNFASVPAPKIQRSVFNRSHGHKTTFDSGYLIPVLVDEILPGDTVNLRASFLARLSTLVFPIMDNIFLDCQFFFSPTRLLWANWEKFLGFHEDPESPPSDPPPPSGLEIPIHGLGGSTWSIDIGSLMDYMGIPTEPLINDEDAPSCLPTRMYARVWNEWYRDQNLQDSASFSLGDGPDSPAIAELRKRGKRHDYFTSCLPWPQKGDAVSLPIGAFSDVPVIGNGKTISFTNSLGDQFGLSTKSSPPYMYADENLYNTDVGTSVAEGTNPPDAQGSIGLTSQTDGRSGMIADTSSLSASATTINDLREAFAVQQILEMEARGGTRYIEWLRYMFGTISPDYRLNRTEYLGGYSQRIEVSAVPQQSASPGTPTNRDVQAGLAAYATAQAQSGFVKSFVEHGYIMCLVSVRSDMTYQQGMRRMWSRKTKYDFYMPPLAHLGEQAVLNKEIWFPSDDTAVANGVFGYQERWAEYRYFPSYVSGKMRSAASGSLDAWHLAFDFGSLPQLNDEFIVEQPPIDRVVAVTTEPQIIMDCYFDIKHARPMPVYSIPGLNRL